MSTSIIGIPTTRVSDQFIRTRLLNQVTYDQAELFRIQTQLSTGRRFEAPSEDPVAALRVMSLQRLLERKSQVMSNIKTNGSYLSNTDVTLSDTSSLLAEMRGQALTVIDTISTQTQRDAVAQQVDEALRQLVDTGNQKFRGRYLFAGTWTSTQPFRQTEEGHIVYDGNEKHLEAYGDIDLLFQTNFTGSEVFGAVSDPVRATEDLDPVLTFDTRLADIRHGQGLSKGSIKISDGTSVSTIDLSSATTIGEVAQLIRNNPPTGRELFVEVTNETITLQLDNQPGTDLTILEVGSGTVANELGILRETGVGNAKIPGRDLDPVLRETTLLGNMFGVKAAAILRSDTEDSDIRIEANVNGPTTEDGVALNGLAVSIVDDASIVVGNEYADYDDVANTLTVHVDGGFSTAADVIQAINTTANLPFTASMDRLDDVEGGAGFVTVGTTATTSGGSGIEFDKDSGLRVTNQGNTYDISFSAAETVQDMLNTLNGFGAGLLAEIDADARSIDIRSRVSGADFMIGENGGTTATELGLRTFTSDTSLDSLNYGRGVNTADGTDFTIALADGSTPLEADISGLETIGEVLAYLNTLAPASLEARLAEFGNGIELIDTSTGSGTLTVERTIMSHAAIDLGLVPDGAEASLPPVASGTPEALVTSAGAKNDLIFTALNDGAEYNDTRVVFDAAIPPGPAVYNAGVKTLTFGIQGGRTASQIIGDLAADPTASALFQATLDPDDDSGNDGTGNVEATDPANPPQTSGGNTTNYATATITSTGFDNDMIFTSRHLGASSNSIEIELVDNPGSGAATVSSYTPGVNLTIQFDSAASHTAQDIQAAVVAHGGANADWQVTFDPNDASPNNGSNNVTANDVPMVGGEQTLTGADVHQIDTEGVFTSLLRLSTALRENDVPEMQRAIEMLDERVIDLNFVRAELGAAQQSLDTLTMRLEDEDVELKEILSDEYDADMVNVISELTARQAAFEASLRSMGSIFQMTLLNYL